MAALLRTVVHQAVLADIEVARAGAAPPLVRLAIRQVVLKAANPRIEILEDLPGPVDGGRHLVVNLALDRSERLEAARPVVDDADRGGEAELAGAVVDGARVLGVPDAAAEDGVDVDVEPRVGLEVLKLLIEYAQALLRHVVRLDVVDADLQEVESRRVQLLDSLRHEEVAVRDQ